MTYHSLSRRILQLATLAAVGVFISEHVWSFPPPSDSSIRAIACENVDQSITSHNAQVPRSPSLHPTSALPSNQQGGINRFIATFKDIQLDLRTYFHPGN
jgi:hypothetical protein